MDIKFNPVVDLGQIIALFGFIAVIIGLLFQARSLSIAKKELNLKVENLSDIISRIEKETNEREKLENKHKGLLSSHNKYTVENMNYSTYVLKTFLATSEMNDQLIRGRFEILCFSVITICELLLKSEYTDSEEILNSIVEINNLLTILIEIERANSKEVESKSKEWHKEFDELLKQYELSPSTNLEQRIDKRIAEYKELTDKSNDNFSREITAPQKQYNDAVKRFFVLRKKMIG